VLGKIDSISINRIESKSNRNSINRTITSSSVKFPNVTDCWQS